MFLFSRFERSPCFTNIRPRAIRTRHIIDDKVYYIIAAEQCTNVVYNIPCSDCPWSYVGETGRSFETRKKEHIRSVKNCKKGSNIAKHAWDLNHRIDFNNGKIIDSGNYRTPRLESLQIALPR